MQGRLDALVARAWDLFSKIDAGGQEFVVRPSVPILYFGDHPAYLDSELKVVTVGLNPSLMEFDGPDPFHRFPLARSASPLEGPLTGYVAALNAYFQTDPYRSWFSCYEPVLKGLGVSFYGGVDGTALHTDICSPIATDPTWSALPVMTQRTLWQEGHALWHDLVRELEPDIIIASIARRYLTSLAFDPLQPPQLAFTIDRRNPYSVMTQRLGVISGKETLLVTGKAAQKPFGTVSEKDKINIGVAIRGLRDG